MIPCDPDLRARLVSAAQQQEAPDLLVTGGTVWSPFTGERLAADVAVCGERIAFVGPWTGPVEDTTEHVDAAGRTIVPGYVEPHTHPWPFVNPLSLGEQAVCCGTTALLYDNLLTFLALGADGCTSLALALSRVSLPHIFWGARIASQSRFPGEEVVFGQQVIARLLENPEFIATAEMTRWPDILHPELGQRLQRIMEGARRSGRYVDGHTAGASARRLPALQAAGMRSCHEAITAEEAHQRLRQGFWVLLRNSSLRPDLEQLLPALQDTTFTDRIAFTTDGAKAHHIAEHGHIDAMIRTALEGGVAPDVAYRMATLNAAAVMKMDEDLGAVAPGRIANLNLLTDLHDPTPCAVVCRGRLAAEDGELCVAAPSESFPWEDYYSVGAATIPDWKADKFLLPSHAPDPFPAGRLVNAVITRESPVALRAVGTGRWPAEEEAVVAALTDRSGAWISRGVISDLAPELEALAGSYTTNAGILVLGRSPEAMAAVLAELRAVGGGVVLRHRRGWTRSFPLPLAGIQRPGRFAPAAEMAAAYEASMRECGYRHADPNYTLLFLSCDFLPDLRLTRNGWVRIKTGEVLLPTEC